MSTIKLSHPSGEINGSINLEGSKSISNRVLIIRALCKEHFNISKLSTCDDTVTLDRLLVEGGMDNVYDVGHAGTTFRFLTAYLAMQEGTQILTGSSRMLERPIGPLVDALRHIGCDIGYEKKEGYPPLRIGPGNVASLKSEVTIDSGISSQYITALILIAPILPKGLKISLRGEMVSESYLQLTLGIVKDFGINVRYSDNLIEVAHQPYVARNYTIEADWSASSYHYALVALARRGSLRLEGLFEDSLQGDAAMPTIGKSVGVSSSWQEGGWQLSKAPLGSLFSYNFINQPDVAQTLGVICAAKMINNDFYGLKTLRIKETDRIYAMDKELSKIGSGFKPITTGESREEHFTIMPCTSFKEGIPRFETYRDHRMAMSFAPLALLHTIEIEKPEVVTKSYPKFWEDLLSLGFRIDKVS